MTDLVSEAETIRKLTREWFAAEVRRDMEASLSYLTPDAIFQPPGAPSVTDAAAMRAFYEEFFKTPYKDVVMDPRTVVVADSGDFAYDIGTFRIVLEGPDGSTEELPGKSTIIWRKFHDGWKAVVMTFSTDNPPVSSSDQHGESL